MSTLRIVICILALSNGIVVAESPTSQPEAKVTSTDSALETPEEAINRFAIAIESGDFEKACTFLAPAKDATDVYVYETLGQTCATFRIVNLAAKRLGKAGEEMQQSYLKKITATKLMRENRFDVVQDTAVAVSTGGPGMRGYRENGHWKFRGNELPPETVKKMAENSKAVRHFTTELRRIASELEAGQIKDVDTIERRYKEAIIQAKATTQPVQTK